MRHNKIEKVPAVEAHEREVFDNTTCDLCQSVIERPCGFEVEDISVEARIGTRYPEGGSGDECKIDLCLGCFKDKLIPFIESESGTVVNWMEWDW